MDLSVIIPARNEEFLELTINSVLDNAKAKTEVISILDGYWPEPIKDRPNLTLVHHSEPIGQRAATNEGARISQAKYIMKLDAHCALDKGFDVKLIESCESDWTVIPRMYNLHAFDWKCVSCGKRTYQGPIPEKCECGDGRHEKKILWRPRSKRHYTDYWQFDKDLKFQYWQKRKSDKLIDDTMSCIGACFFMKRDRYWEIDGMDEGHGSWGQMGTELACKTWLSGGRMVVNKNTWFAHLFRTQSGFKFPYEIKHSDQEKAREYSRNLWLKNAWPKQKHKLDWLVKRFDPPTWKGGKLDLSVIIPARNEKYLLKTIKDIKRNFTSNYEIIVGLDNYEPEYKLPEYVRIYRAKKRVGMRRLINDMAKMAYGKYIMKTDAHCSFDKGYDSKLLSVCGHGLTVLGIRYELDVDKWEKKERTNCDFRYLSNPFVDNLGGLRGLPWHEWKKVTKGQKLAESMSLSGSGWMMLKDQFDWFDGLDENHGTMYQEGAEIACKTWLSGGKLLINRDTWYAHHNRGKAPYSLSSKQRTKSINYSIELWKGNNWPKQKYSFDWLIDKFKPPGWYAVSYQPLPAKRQGTLHKAHKRLRVKDLWDKRVEISEPGKRFRLEVFFKVFEEFLSGKEEGYYNYLISHTSKRPVYKPDKRTVERTKRKMEGGKRLLRSIKNKGMLTPLEFYQKDGNLILFRGYRRLAILKHLKVNRVAARVHISEETAKNVSAPFRIKKGSINELGSKQFAEISGLATDKYFVHNYLEIYDRIFDNLRNQRIKIIEFGILRGASLRIWHQAFPKASIYGVDKNLTTWKDLTKDLDRVKVLVGMQQDDKFIDSTVIPNGPFDIVIDDCSHQPDMQFNLFKKIWPQLNKYGYYIIEDCYGSYKPRQEQMNIPQTIASWVDSIYRDYEVLSIQLHYNLCIIQKGI